MRRMSHGQRNRSNLYVFTKHRSGITCSTNWIFQKGQTSQIPIQKALNRWRCSSLSFLRFHSDAVNEVSDGTEMNWHDIFMKRSIRISFKFNSLLFYTRIKLSVFSSSNFTLILGSKFPCFDITRLFCFFCWVRGGIHNLITSIYNFDIWPKQFSSFFKLRFEYE